MTDGRKRPAMRVVAAGRPDLLIGWIDDVDDRDYLAYGVTLLARVPNALFFETVRFPLGIFRRELAPITCPHGAKIGALFVAQMAVPVTRADLPDLARCPSFRPAEWAFRRRQGQQ